VEKIPPKWYDETESFHMLAPSPLQTSIFAGNNEIEGVPISGITSSGTMLWSKTGWKLEMMIRPHSTGKEQTPPGS
jgi:hypothetical protein